MAAKLFVLVCGGAGYIGSHTVLEILKGCDYTPIVADNLSNSSLECLTRIEGVVGKAVNFYEIDLAKDPKTSGLDELFSKYNFYAVINFAGLKAVGESMCIPLSYYQCNLQITFNLLSTMKAHGIKNYVFSSSACVYGAPQYLPIDEKHPVGNCTNVYGKSKYFIEVILQDLFAAEKDWNIVILRYFNPVGAHESGNIGEDPKGIPNNLMPFVTQVAIGKRDVLSIFGNDYPTADGTGVRDYIHVVDLAKGHVSSLDILNTNCGLKVYNLGTGSGYSVLEVVAGIEKASGKEVPYKIVSRRDGDVPTSYADVSLANTNLGWKAAYGINQMCADAWNWQMKNPNGYASK